MQQVRMRSGTTIAVCIGLFLSLFTMYFKFHPSNKSDGQEANLFRWIDLTVGDIQNRRRVWNMYYDNKGQLKVQRLPNVIGIGVRKCGTGTLHRFIGEHPLVRISAKETHYYDSHRNKGLDYYRQMLPAATRSQLVSEKTPAYFRSLPFDLPEIIDREIPRVKLWLILCDPVRRAFSDFVMRMRRAGQQIDNEVFEKYVNTYSKMVKRIFRDWNETFDGLWNSERISNALLKDKRSYTFAHGIYAYYIKRWLQVFPPDRLLIIDGQELLRDPGAVIESLQDFLDIPKLLRRRDFVRHPKSGLYCLRPWWRPHYDFLAEYRRYSSWEDGLVCSSPSKGLTQSRNASFSMSPRMESRLLNFFEPYNHMLYQILNRTMSW